MIAGLAGSRTCCSSTQRPGALSTISLAWRWRRSCPLGPRSAPVWRHRRRAALRRSTLMVSGMVRSAGCCARRTRRRARCRCCRWWPDDLAGAEAAWAIAGPDHRRADAVALTEQAGLRPSIFASIGGLRAVEQHAGLVGRTSGCGRWIPVLSGYPGHRFSPVGVPGRAGQKASVTVAPIVAAWWRTALDGGARKKLEVPCARSGTRSGTWRGR